MAIFREYVPTIGYEDRTTDEVYAAVRDPDTASRLSLALFKKGMLTPQEFLDVLNLQGDFVVRDDL